MRIDDQSQTIKVVNSSNQITINPDKRTSDQNVERISEDVVFSEDKLKQAVDSINEIFEINNSELKFVFHDGLKEYFVQLVDSKTEEVVKEIPSKKLLDVFYEMQKLVGMIVDEKI